MFEMSYGDALKVEIESLASGKQRTYFLSVYEAMGDYLRKTDEFLTFGEFLRMYE